MKNVLFPDIYDKIFSKDKGMTAIDESGLITAGTMLNAEFRCPMYFDRFDLLSSKFVDSNNFDPGINHTTPKHMQN